MTFMDAVGIVYLRTGNAPWKHWISQPTSGVGMRHPFLTMAASLRLEQPDQWQEVVRLWRARRIPVRGAQTRPTIQQELR